MPHSQAPRSYDLVIVGGGFSGLTVALNLARLNVPIRVAILEPQMRLGAGSAYGTNSGEHLLNVRAAFMSIWSDKPDDFVEWLKTRYPHYSAESFVPRGIFGEYLQWHLKESLAVASLNLEQIRAEVKAVRPTVDGFRTITGDDREIFSSRVVLAPGTLDFSRGEMVGGVSLPFDQAAIGNAISKRSIAVLGTALTAIDTVLELEARGFCGNYTMISRHGNFPHPHPEPPFQVGAAAKLAAQRVLNSGNLRAAVRQFRIELSDGVPWWELIDALRDGTPKFWHRLQTRELACFFRHLRNLWDQHRHRVPAQTIAKIHRLQSAGRLSVISAKVEKVEQLKTTSRVTMRRRGATISEELEYEMVFSCLGLSGSIARTNDSLMRQLIDEGLVKIDRLGIGFETDDAGTILARSGQSVAGLSLIGTLRRGVLGEGTAIRELRPQAEQIAAEIRRFYGRNNSALVNLSASSLSL